MRRWFAYCTSYNIAWYYGFYKITAFLADLFKWRIFVIFFILLCKLFPIVALLYSRGFKQTWIYTTLGCYKPGWHITSVNMYNIYVRTRCSLYCESRSVGKRILQNHWSNEVLWGYLNCFLNTFYNTTNVGNVCVNKMSIIRRLY